jgi:RNA polymerase sigma-70 factor (sigma-E family)
MPQRSREDFVEFFVARQSHMLRTAYLLCNDRQFAEDIVQQVLEKLYVAWPKVTAARSPDAYVRKAVMNVYLDEMRRAWRHRERSNADPTDGRSELRSPPLDDRVDLARALSRLPQRQRVVLILRFAEDLSVAETAALLGCAEGTVKAHTAAGTRALRQVAEMELQGANT